MFELASNLLWTKYLLHNFWQILTNKQLASSRIESFAYNFVTAEFESLLVVLVGKILLTILLTNLFLNYFIINTKHKNALVKK